jgi:signal peptidase II
MRLLLCVALPLYALDQATKFWVIRHIQNRIEQRPVVPGFFHLCYWDNTGAAFGMFKDNNVALIVLSLVALVGLIMFQLRGTFQDRFSRLGVALLVSGILGNVTDRLVHDHVVDFLLFYLRLPGADPWPAFNVADSCICVAAALFIIGSLRHDPPTPLKTRA